MKTDTKPSSLTLCTLLARRDHMAGALLNAIRHWTKYSRAEIPDEDGTWCANPHTWWMRECSMSAGQLSRNLRKLDEWGLIERRQFWFGRRNVLYVRASDMTTAYVEAAQTWPAAFELLPEAQKGAAETAAAAGSNKNGKLSSSFPASSTSGNDKLGPSKLAISKVIIDGHNKPIEPDWLCSDTM